MMPFGGFHEAKRQTSQREGLESQRGSQVWGSLYLTGLRIVSVVTTWYFEYFSTGLMVGR